MAALLVLLGMVLALLGTLLVGDVRTVGGLRRAARRPVADPVPAVAPAATEIRGTRPDGTPIAVPPTAGATLLAFLGSTCVTCDAIWRGADRAAKDAGRRLRIVVVTRGPEAESARMVAAKAPHAVPVVMSDAIWTAHGVRTAPAFVVTDGSGTAVRLDAPASWPELLAAAEATR